MEGLKSQQHWHRGLILSLFGALMVIVYLYGMVWVPSYQERVAKAELALEELWQNPNGELPVLREDVDEQTLHQIYSELVKLAPEEYTRLAPSYEEAFEQLAFRQWSDSVLRLTVQDGTLKIDVQADVNDQQILQLRQKAQNILTQHLDQWEAVFESARHQLREMESGLAYLGEYESSVTYSRDNLNDALELLNKASDHLEPWLDQTYLASYLEQYQHQLSLFADYLVKEYQVDSYTEATMLQIQENPALFTLLDGTPLHQRPKIALTFDDGPNEEFTPQILNILNQYGAKGVFFVYGAYVEQFPDMARRIINEGHLIGNHSYSHPNFDDISDGEVLQQINWTQEIVEEATGYLPTMYRMPFGAGGLRVVQLLPELTSITWNLDSLDWQLQDAQAIFDRVIPMLSNDTLLLMHDTSQTSVDALALLMPVLVERGYEFVFPDQLIYQNRYYE